MRTLLTSGIHAHVHARFRTFTHPLLRPPRPSSARACAPEPKRPWLRHPRTIPAHATLSCPVRSRNKITFPSTLAGTFPARPLPGRRAGLGPAPGALANIDSGAGGLKVARPRLYAAAASCARRERGPWEARGPWQAQGPPPLRGSRSRAPGAGQPAGGGGGQRGAARTPRPRGRGRASGERRPIAGRGPPSAGAALQVLVVGGGGGIWAGGAGPGRGSRNARGTRRTRPGRRRGPRAAAPGGRAVPGAGAQEGAQARAEAPVGQEVGAGFGGVEAA